MIEISCHYKYSKETFSHSIKTTYDPYGADLEPENNSYAIRRETKCATNNFKEKNRGRTN